MEKIDVKHLGVVIGHTYDGHTIEFLDNEQSKVIQKMISEGYTGLSSRRMGTVDEKGNINYKEITEYSVVFLII